MRGPRWSPPCPASRAASGPDSLPSAGAQTWPPHSPSPRTLREASEDHPVRLFLAQLSHETNTFSNLPTDRAQFEARDLRYGEEIVETFRGTGTCVGGMIA